MSNLPTDNRRAPLLTDPTTWRGLTEVEAKDVDNFVTRGKPGFSEERSDKIKTLYMTGQTCQQIADMFPEYQLDMILYARWKFDWDGQIREKRAMTPAALAMALENIKADITIMTISQIQATIISKQKELNKYMLDPEREKLPESIAKSNRELTELIQRLKELTAPPEIKGKPGELSAATPLVSVNINTSKGKPDIEVKQEPSAKDVLMGKLKKKNGQSEPAG